MININIPRSNKTTFDKTKNVSQIPKFSHHQCNENDIKFTYDIGEDAPAILGCGSIDNSSRWTGIVSLANQKSILQLG
jgi:hypothetical protein